MSEHVAYVVEVKNLRPHTNADRLQIATFFGNDTCVSLGVKIGDKGIYIPTDIQLSQEFCDANHLCRKTKDGEPDTGYMDENKRNVKAIKLRGEKSDGIYLPLTCLETFMDISTLKVGDTIGEPYVRKYIPRGTKTAQGPREGNRTRKHKVPIAPLFAEHADTEQLAYHLNEFKPGDQIEITLKMHGTSFRVAHLPVLQGYKRSFWNWLFRRKGTPIYDWDYISGTRRCVLSSFDGGFYGNNEFRKPVEDFFRGKLLENEEIFGEIVGYINKDTPIMPSASNKKINDKNFIKQYGENTIFSYGCGPGNCDFYVYRMIYITNEGNIIEYPPYLVRYRCEQMGAKYVPLLWQGYIPEVLPRVINFMTNEEHQMTAGEYIKNIAEKYYDGPDPIGKTHVREGVVIRIVNRPKFCAYKHKNFSFKVLSGLAADLAAESGATDTMDEDRLAEL